MVLHIAIERLCREGLNRGNASTKSGIIEGQAMQACKGYLSLQAIAQSGNVDAMQEYGLDSFSFEILEE